MKYDSNSIIENYCVALGIVRIYQMNDWLNQYGENFQNHLKTTPGEYLSVDLDQRRPHSIGKKSNFEIAARFHHVYGEGKERQFQN